MHEQVQYFIFSLSDSLDIILTREMWSSEKNLQVTEKNKQNKAKVEK